MFKARTFTRSFGALSLVALMVVSAFADTIRLKDGSIIKGKITEFSGGSFVVVVGEGSRRREMRFTAADVESVEFEGATTARNTVPVRNDPPRSEPRTTSNPPRVVISDTTTASTKPTITQPVKQPEVKTETASTPPKTVPANIPRKPTTGTAKPIEVSVKVVADNANNGWTNSGWVVKKGQRIKITGSGEISIGGGKTTAAGGLYDLEDETKLLKAVPTGALIAVIGDDNNEFIYIGAEREFVATRDGALFLGVNEGNLNDNSGSFEVKIEIATDSI